MQRRRKLADSRPSLYNSGIEKSAEAIEERGLDPETASAEQSPALADPDASVPTAFDIEERVVRILESAEQEATRIREQASREADEYVERVRERADALAAQRIAELSRRTEAIEAYISRVQDQSAEMVETLDRAIVGSHRDSAVNLPKVEGERPDWAGLIGVSPSSEDHSPLDAFESPDPGEAPADQRLVDATRMALAGRSREEITQMLQSVHGLADPEPILRAVLGI